MSPIKMQKLESGIRLVAELIECINAHKLDALLKLFGDDCVLDPFFAGSPDDKLVGKDLVHKYFEVLFKERKDIHFSTEEILGFGHRCMIRWLCRWRDETGMERSLRGMDIIREKNDRICEILSYCKTEEGK